MMVSVAGHRSDDSARDRSIDEAAAGADDASGDPFDRGRRTGRHQDDDAVLRQRGEPAVVEQDRLGLRRVHHHQHESIGPARRIGGR